MSFKTHEDTVAIDRIEFGLLSPDEIVNYSVAEIQYTEPFENHAPKVGGLLDLRMGTVEKDVRCATCNCKMNLCPGHFGHINLARPVYHIYFIPVIKKLLECICLVCARIRITQDNEEYRRLSHVRSAKQRFKLFWKVCKSKEACDYTDCGAQCPQIRQAGGDIVRGRPKSRAMVAGTVEESNAPGAARRVMTPSEIREILCRITDAESALLGFDPVNARPEWMILTVLPVPPPCVRPSVAMGSGSRGEDDITVKLCDIIRFNRLIQRNETDAMTKSLDEYEPLLQYHVSTLFDNETNLYAKSTQKGGRPIKSYKARITGKNGRIRSNLMGRRVDFTARTVITGDPNLSIEQVGIPYQIAMNLTFPERVTTLNIARLQDMVDRGPEEYPGAVYIQTKDRRIDLNSRVKEEYRHFRQLKIGDVVNRHLLDGDLILFNRQPTLHKMSMMVHRVKVMSGKTFRMGLSTTTPYNADFDGDCHLVSNR